MLFRTPLILAAIMLMAATIVRPAAAQHEIVRVWPGDAPGSEDWTHEEQVTESPFDGFDWVRNVVAPTLTVYRPDPADANGTAVIVAPGGGFYFLSIETEGSQVAEWLAERGVTAFLLRYRVVPTPPSDGAFLQEVQRLFTDVDAVISVMLETALLAAEDGREAVRLLRRRSDEWGIDPDRIGMLGFSAGGRVTVDAALSENPDSRPSFAAPIYGALWDDLSVPADAPPLFTLVAQDDALAEASVLDLYQAWNAAGADAELHVYSQGGHGFGMKQQGLPIDSWIERFGEWMEAHGWFGTGAE